MNEYRKFSDFNFNVSPQLARIAQKCLQINKTDRYPNMGALLDELEAAHRSLTSDSPAKILKRYIANPDDFEDKFKGKVRLKISTKILLPVAGVLGIGALVAIFIITGPKSEPGDTSAETTQTETATPQPKQQTPQQRTGTGLTPLGPMDTKSSTDKESDNRTTTARETPQPKPPRPRTPRRETPRPKTPDKVVSTPKPQPELSPLEKLKKRYGQDDVMTIGKKAMMSKNYKDAILALENVPAGHPEKTIKTLLLFDAYLATGNIKDALFIANNENIVDAQFDYLCGRLYERTGKDKRALEYFQSALTKPSAIRGRSEIRNDALYQTAILWSAQHRTSPTADSRIQALNAWNTVKRTYMGTPDHPRFKRANKELATIH